ncbi:hypothetical protein, partial [Staphylococcus warneri]|uniref:hypothetical protein n=1 Tax=Staphylococcus warneri TaxID=1292 RepID=UPI001C97EA55
IGRVIGISLCVEFMRGGIAGIGGGGEIGVRRGNRVVIEVCVLKKGVKGYVIRMVKMIIEGWMNNSGLLRCKI